MSSTPEAPAPPTAVSTFAWIVVAVLVPVALLNYLDRQMLATMKMSMMKDVPDIETEARWGLVLGCFKWVYAIMSPLGGYLADRLSRRHVIAGSLFVWSAVTWLTGHVETYPQLMAARALMGISEAFYIPAALALIADFHFGATRSRAIGFHQMGIYAGLILGGFAGYAADAPTLGWRWAFTICGLIGVVYALPLFAILRNPPATAGPVDRPSPSGALRLLFGNNDYLLLVVYFTLPAIAGWVVKDWMPAILNKEFNLGQGKSGVSAVLYVQIASIVGAVVGGWWADRWIRSSQRGRIFVSALGMSLFLPSLAGVGIAITDVQRPAAQAQAVADDQPADQVQSRQRAFILAVAFLMLFGVGWGIFDCNNMPILCQLVRPELRATGYGIMNLVSISCGGFADWGFGFLRDRHVGLDLIFGAFAGIALLSIFVVLMIRPRETT